MSFPLLPTYFYSVDTHNRNLLKSLVTMSRVRTHTENRVSQNTVKKQEYQGDADIWRGKKESEWTGKIEIKTRKTFLEVDEACLAIFDIFQTLKGGHLSGLDSQLRGS